MTSLQIHQKPLSTAGRSPPRLGVEVFSAIYA
jgi:hypothetical protein